jgi:hypothetical protein
VLTVAKTLTERSGAGDIIRPIAAIVGSGGGPGHGASGRHRGVARPDEAIEAVYSL